MAQYIIIIIEKERNGVIKMRVEVQFSYTVDYGVWDCPKCGCHNVLTMDSDNDGVCESCGFEIEGFVNRIGECDSIEDVYEVDDEDDE